MGSLFFLLIYDSWVKIKHTVEEEEGGFLPLSFLIFTGRYLLVTLSFQGMVNSSDEPAHIKEALSRLVVELIKREWPQNWGSLLPELNNICGFGVHFAINMKLIYSTKVALGL